MNVKTGDLAFIIGSSGLAGRIVEVLARAPIGIDFRLPDGYIQAAQNYEWVVRFNSPVEAPTSTGSRATNYACAPDGKLRPISGVPVLDETPIETKLPDPLHLALGITAGAFA